jgi:hypothetical protein
LKTSGMSNSSSWMVDGLKGKVTAYENFVSINKVA